MNEIMTKLKDIVQVEQISASCYSVHLPILYYGGDWVVIEVTQNNSNTFGISDGGYAISNAQTIINNLDNINFKRTLTNIVKEFDLEASDTGNLFLKDISSEQLYSAISSLANASQKLSNQIIESCIVQETKKIHDLVANKLQTLFKNDYKKKVILDYEVLGQSSKQYNIPFCIDNSIKRYIEPITNNANAIATVHTKFYDIGQAAQHKREIVIDDFNNWETPNIELLKPICETISPYNKIAI